MKRLFVDAAGSPRLTLLPVGLAVAFLFVICIPSVFELMEWASEWVLWAVRKLPESGEEIFP